MNVTTIELYGQCLPYMLNDMFFNVFFAFGCLLLFYYHSSSCLDFLFPSFLFSITLTYFILSLLSISLPSSFFSLFSSLSHLLSFFFSLSSPLFFLLSFFFLSFPFPTSSTSTLIQRIWRSTEF